MLLPWRRFPPGDGRCEYIYNGDGDVGNVDVVDDEPWRKFPPECGRCELPIHQLSASDPQMRAARSPGGDQQLT